MPMVGIEKSRYRQRVQELGDRNHGTMMTAMRKSACRILSFTKRYLSI
jgi:hypothetical protein